MAAVPPSSQRAPLEDLMVAMDVVDTIRHRRELVDRELDSEARRARLVERLRRIYRDQGIEVSDAALKAGVLALEEDRFAYEPPASGWRVTLARMYVTRRGWGKPLGILTATIFGLWLLWYLIIGLPAARERAVLPAAQLETLAGQLEQTYEVRIVSRPNELSGVWRVPALNPGARNYYLIVEALDTSRRRIKVPIESEEDGVVRSVATWGVRVDEATFEGVAADKRDDGIIQGNLVGRKTPGKLEPDYLIPVHGGKITEW
jgi:hypothetical protein